MTENLTAALAAVQKALPEVGKDKTAKVETRTGGSYKYSYADLAAVSKAILPKLADNGLAWVTRPTLADGRLVLAYELRHTSGESIEGAYPLTGNTPQEIGSAITYARRYCLCSVTGVAPESDDDDAAAASHRPQESWEQAAKPPTPEQASLAEGFEVDIKAADSLEALMHAWNAMRDARRRDEITDAQGVALRAKWNARKAELRAEQGDAK